MTNWIEKGDLPTDHSSHSIRAVADACRNMNKSYRLWVMENTGAALLCATAALFDIGAADDLTADKISPSERTFILLVDVPDVSDLTLPESEEGSPDWVGLTDPTAKPVGVGQEAVGTITLPSATAYSIHATHTVALDKKAVFRGAPTKLGEQPGHLEGRGKWFKKR